MPGSQNESDPGTSARELHRRSIIVDGHCDTPYRLHRHKLRLDDSDPEAQLDLESLQRSGITASFFVSYVPAFYAGRGAAAFAHRLIDLILRETNDRPGVLRLATRCADILEAKRTGEIAILIGVEGGHAIEDSLEILRSLYDRGVRYLTLTHVNHNNWADSSGQPPRHGGLTAFGRDVVRAMNDLGMIVDVSHVSDATFDHVIETTRVPVVATHSSCRALANHPRNLTDRMLRDLARHGGLCMINFFPAFVNEGVARVLLAAQGPSPIPDALPEYEEIPTDRSYWDGFLAWYRSIDCPESTLDDVIDHIAHAAEVAGIDHVGIGTDLDGVPALPSGFETAAEMPRVTERMLGRGFAETEVEKILGGNFIRVFREIEEGRTGGG